MTQDLVLLVARAALCSAFLYSGTVKLFSWTSSEAEFSALGLPRPSLVHAATIATQLFGGIGLLTGLMTLISAGLLALFTVTATLVAHPFWRMTGSDNVRMLTAFLEHAGLTAGLVLICVTGPGRFSLDASFL